MNRGGAEGAEERGVMLRRSDLGSGVNALTGRILGAAVEVHRELGPGFLESVYEQALAVELELRGISFARQVPVELTYKGRHIGDSRLDLVADGEVIIEFKATDSLLPIHEAQLISYLRATGLNVGLLINFNVPVLKHGIERIVQT